jgi:carotenoid cleavage dioxygenase-like enzyme
MSISFADHTEVRDGINRGRVECDIHELEYDGDIPADLNGTFYRAGSDPQYPSNHPHDTRWNGDGMVSMFRFEDGHVDFRSRYVRTDRFLAERAARRALFGAYRNRFTDDPSVATVSRELANTSILWLGKRLYALKEDGLPWEISPDTLDTIGRHNFGGKMRSKTFSAHSKLDADTGRLYWFGTEATGECSPDIAYGAIDADGSLAFEEGFKAPYASMLHDFAISQEDAVFQVMPTVSDLERMRSGGPHFKWDGTRQTHVIVVPREGGVEQRRTFTGPARWSFHTMNAFREGALLHLDSAVALVDRSIMTPEFANEVAAVESIQPYLTRWTFDMGGSGDSFTETRLFDKPAEFTITDPRYHGKAYRYGFMLVKDADAIGQPFNLNTPYNSVYCIDHHTGESKGYFVGANAAVQEPVFVPRTPDAPEGDGYLLFVVNRFDEVRATLAVMDAMHLDRGPVALVKLPIQLPLAFHGAWVDASDR